jgi:DNA polymerase-1
MAINMPLQSLGADILKLAMIKIRASYLAKKIWGQKIKILLSIHDELLLEISDDMLKTILPEIKNIMENIVPLNPDLKVDVSIGKNWGSLLPA